MPGTPLSTNRGRSCPLRNATGRTSVIHCEDWYNAQEKRVNRIAELKGFRKGHGRFYIMNG
jgi:hypothetical protein